MNFSGRMVALGAEFNAKIGDYWSMGDPQSVSSSGTYSGNPHGVGVSRSWVPVLGPVVWQQAARPYGAYICKLSGNRTIGYVRIPHYSYSENDVKNFEEIITRFESTTDGMVLDQVNNHGGSMFQMYALLSTLTDRPLNLPKHQLMIDEDQAAVAADVVSLAERGGRIPPGERPSTELVTYSQFVLSERAAGRGINGRLSDPTYLAGVVQVLPAEHHYTKKIVVLINAKTFSAGEFLAAILQDNHRATLFGETTGGGGGCAKRFHSSVMDELNMIQTMPWTLACRTNGMLIENIGVLPDIHCPLTVEDIRTDYEPYFLSLLSTINAL